jgi:hypothetical protein
VAVAGVLKKVAFAATARCYFTRWARHEIQPHRRPANPGLGMDSDFGHDNCAVEIGLERG